MKSGYKIVWTDHALNELRQTFDYLEYRFSEKELHHLATEIERVLGLISQTPKLFPISDKSNVRKVVILKFNSMYYHQKETGEIEILSFFSNRQSPEQRKL